MQYICLLSYFFIVCLYKSYGDSDESEENILYDESKLHCIDNSYRPVDWWIIYKPSQDTGPFFESGINFTYITSRSSGRWKPSYAYINANSMLQFTLAPLYEKSFKKNLAILSYGEGDDEEPRQQKSTAYGILYGDSRSGIWISHTIPGFPNPAYPPVLPDDAYSKGHLIMCLAVNLDTLNAITTVVRHTEPNIVMFSLPLNLLQSLPEWGFIESGVNVHKNELNTKLFNFATRGNSLRGVILSRRPTDPRSPYNTFAKLQSIVLDIHSNPPYRELPICEATYSIRKIDAISLKYPEQQVYYIANNTDKISFGVSTAASWQRTGMTAPQHWTCIGNVDHQTATPAKGGMIACLNDYLIWSTFDNLKTKEPEC